MKRNNPKPYKRDKTITVHSLLRCKNVNCSKFWDRDVNGSTNILNLALNYLDKNERLDNFKRPKRTIKDNKSFLLDMKNKLKNVT